VQADVDEWTHGAIGNEWPRLRRRFLALLGLRCFQTGLQLPVFVLVMQARGLSVTAIGVVFAVVGATTAFFELPTGGLADVLGRRPVLIAAGLLLALQSLAFGFGRHVAVFIVAAAIGGVGRALDSGPLEAWFVDAAGHAESDFDLTRELSRTRAVEAGSLGLGTLASGALVTVAPWPARGADVIALSVPFLVSAGICLVALAATVRWVRDPANRAQSSLHQALRRVPDTIRSGVRLAAAAGPLRRVSVLMATLGVALATVELLAPVSFADLVRDEDEAASLYAVLVTIGFFGSAVGSTQAQRIVRRLRSPAYAILAVRIIAAGTMLLLATTSLGVSSVAIVAFFALNGVARPLVGHLIHSSVDATQRATALSVQSLALQLSGVVASLAFSRVAQHLSVGIALSIAAAVLAIGASACIALPQPNPPDT
jgi:MFS family permease